MSNTEWIEQRTAKWNDALISRKHMTQEQLEALNGAMEVMKDCLFMLHEMQDLYLSDVRKLQTAHNKLSEFFTTGPEDHAEYLLDQLEEHGFSQGKGGLWSQNDK